MAQASSLPGPGCRLEACTTKNKKLHALHVLHGEFCIAVNGNDSLAFATLGSLGCDALGTGFAWGALGALGGFDAFIGLGLDGLELGFDFRQG